MRNKCALALSLNAQIGDCTFACETSSEFCGVGKKKPIPVIVIRRKNIRGPVPKNTEQECNKIVWFGFRIIKSQNNMPMEKTPPTEKNWEHLNKRVYKGGKK